MIIDHIGIMVDLLTPEHHDAVKQAIKDTLDKYIGEIQVKLGDGHGITTVRVVSLATLPKNKNKPVYDVRMQGKKK